MQAGRLACAQRYRLVVGPGLAGCRWSAREEDGCIGVTRVRLLARVVRTEGGQRVRPFIVKEAIFRLPRQVVDATHLLSADEGGRCLPGSSALEAGRCARLRGAALIPVMVHGESSWPWRMPRLCANALRRCTHSLIVVTREGQAGGYLHAQGHGACQGSVSTSPSGRKLRPRSLPMYYRNSPSVGLSCIPERLVKYTKCA